MVHTLHFTKYAANIQGFLVDKDIPHCYNVTVHSHRSMKGKKNHYMKEGL